jgi:hypothetical protein
MSQIKRIIGTTLARLFQRPSLPILLNYPLICLTATQKPTHYLSVYRQSEDQTSLTLGLTYQEMSPVVRL